MQFGRAISSDAGRGRTTWPWQAGGEFSILQIRLFFARGRRRIRPRDRKTMPCTLSMESVLMYNSYVKNRAGFSTLKEISRISGNLDRFRVIFGKWK